jgi:transglutaminase-like putative cysteine protease
MSKGSGGELFNRRTAAVAIFLLWIAALAWLVDRHYIGDRRVAAGENPRWPVPPGSAFMSVNLAGQQVGLSTITVDTLAEGLRVTEITTIDLPRIVADTPRRTSERTEALYTRGLQLVKFQSDLLTEQGRTRVTGTIDGDSVLRLVSEAPGESSDTQTVTLRRPVVLPGAIPLVAASRGVPRPGSRLNLEVFDPIESELRVERIAVARESLFVVADSAELLEGTRRWEVAHQDTVRAWRLDYLDHGLPTQLWVDGAGLPVRITNTLGAVLDRSAFEMIQTNFRTQPPPVYDSSGTTPVYHLSTGVPPIRKKLTAQVQLAGAAEAFPPQVGALTSGWQVQQGDTIRVAAPDSVLPLDSGTVADQPRWSLSTPDSAVASRARAIIQRETDTARMAELLAAAVRKEISAHPGEARRTPDQVLARRSGSAQERVNLLVALARGAGLKARPVWGLVLVDGSWTLHPWAEIWTRSWTPFDLAGAGHDAGRLRLATGGNSRFLSLVLRAGRLRAAVLEEQR